MPGKTKPEPGAARFRESSPFSLLPEWVRQGTESFFATQRVLLDLVIRQNANTMSAVREGLAVVRSAPAAALAEMASEGVSNFLAAERVLLHLAERENEIVMSGVQERTGKFAPATTLTNLVRRSVENLIDMQQHFLSIAAKQADLWVDSAKSGEPFAGKSLAELARESVENFVRSQKKFLDLIAEETTHFTEGTVDANGHSHKKTEVVELARQATEAFIDAQKKVLDLVAQQVDVNLKTARQTVEALNPFQPQILEELTRHTVDNFVTAEKSLLDVISKPPRAAAAHAGGHEAPPRKAKTHHPKPHVEEPVEA